MSSSRQISVDALGRLRSHGGDLSRALASARGFAELSPSDKAFAFALSFAAVRYRRPLEALLDALLQKRPPEKVCDILLIGAAGLKVLGTPAYAAVNEAVALTPQCFKGLVNAVLKKAADCRVPDVSLLPDDFARRLPPDKAVSLAQAMGRTPPVDVSVRGRFAGLMDSNAFMHVEGLTFTVREERNVIDLPGFSDGWWWVQDRAAALPAAWLTDVEGKRVADLCAAPGGKTMQLADRGARVTAFDISEARLLLLRDNLKRTGLTAAIVNNDPGNFKKDESFDAALLDAPCSASGTFRRNPDVAFKPFDSALPARQKAMLDTAWRLTKPGGEIVYCVCSLWPEEGEDVVRGMPVVRTMRTWPDEERDGFFICLIKKA